ncbi:maleylpyruvate isomerase family mycothiol-dependent enzyme [Couchioplanes caeruleus]|uniref:maleylpyruvate isomerase family mycothiol-dependent enzyme n=1 Tax=Couchioplanes caeruleus TaxID=56438 RepID=UPI0020BD7D53|nr:maleylpyruvate isomerase family mycothiol-dependent enzyme [Couchioplanes caeruleus]UQU65188.1 maleylpyruvate isomerase family mycothiol-dependent enzyme [Couchioplanes caeruleus]
MTIFEMTTANRRLIADVLDSLDEPQWEHPTLCAGWTVRHMAAHVVQPMLIGFGRFLLTAMRYRGDTDRTVDHITRRLARRPRTELVRLLREHAGDRVVPPRVGPMGPFADTCLHLRDIARPLGLDADVPVEHWHVLMDYLTSPSVAPALVRPGRLRGLRLVATDTGRAWGSGAEVAGPVEALAMAAAGRSVALADLRGPGVGKLTI